MSKYVSVALHIIISVPMRARVLSPDIPMGP
jgi:hypothetical protein